MKLNSIKFLCGIGYGLGELGMMAIDVFIRVHLFVFLQSTLKFDPFWVGFAMALGVVWDALMDPWIGVWSDRYKIWKGERFSFIFVGLLLSLLSFILLFHLSIDPNSILGIFILCLLSIFLNSSLTVMSVPYLSLVGEIALSKKERSFLIASRLGLANFGSILGIAIPGYYLAKGMEPYNPSSWLLSGLLVFTVCISVLSAMLLKKMNRNSLQYVSRSSHFSQQNSVVQLFKQIIQDKKFLVILGAYFVANVAMSLNSSLALYYYRERLQLSESEVRNVLLIFLVFFTFSIPLWVWLGQKFSIIRSLNWGVFLLGVSSILIYPLLPAGEVWAVYFFASFLGGLFCGSSVLLEIYFTNEVKVKEAVKQEELLGSYLGIWKMTSKVSRGMTLVVTGPIISLTVLNSLDSERFWLSIAFGPGVGLFFLLSCTVVYRYRKFLSS